jgi:LysM repeat protein
LAIRFGTSVSTLLSLNGNITNANVIYEGQRLVVPSGRGVPGDNPPPPPAGGTYYAQRGDTLRKIAAKYGTTVDVLLRLNPQITNPNVIYVGQADLPPPPTWFNEATHCGSLPTNLGRRWMLY